MLTQVMLGKKTPLDRLPSWMRNLSTLGLEGPATRTAVKILDHSLHRQLR